MRNFQDIFPELTRTLNFDFQDFPGPGIFKKKIQDFPGLSRRRGNPASCWQSQIWAAQM